MKNIWNSGISVDIELSSLKNSGKHCILFLWFIHLSRKPPFQCWVFPHLDSSQREERASVRRQRYPIFSFLEFSMLSPYSPASTWAVFPFFGLFSQCFSGFLPWPDIVLSTSLLVPYLSQRPAERTLLTLVYKWENWGTGRLNDAAHISAQGCRVRLWTQALLLLCTHIVSPVPHVASTIFARFLPLLSLRQKVLPPLSICSDGGHKIFINFSLSTLPAEPHCNFQY